MALNELRQTEGDAQRYGVQAAPEKLQGTPSENKKVFDRLFLNASMVKFNALLDALLDGSAAKDIGVGYVAGVGEMTLHGILERLVEMMQDVSQGSVADGSITSEKLAPGAVKEPQLDTGAVTGAKLAAGAVTTEKIAALAIVTALLADKCVTGAKLADKAVTTDKLMEEAVTGAKLAAGAVNGLHLAAGSVNLAKLAGEVTGKLVSGTVTVDLPVSGWVDKAQTVDVAGVKADNPIVVSAAPASYLAYCEAQIRATGQTAGKVTFTCEDVPDAAVSAVVMIVG